MSIHVSIIDPSKLLVWNHLLREAISRRLVCNASLGTLLILGKLIFHPHVKWISCRVFTTIKRAL